MFITYQLPETATLAWVPCPEIPANYRRMVSDCDNSGAWWFSDMPFIGGEFHMSEFAKWTHIYPKQPKPGDVIECPCGSFRVVRTVRACMACDVLLDEIEQMDMPVMRAWKGELGPDAFWKEAIRDAWQHWGWLVEVKAESEAT